MTSSPIVVPDSAIATPEETRADLLGRQERTTAPIRSAFIQKHGDDRAVGPLHLFVRERKDYALKLYLLLHCVAMGPPWDGTLPAGAWARMLDRTSETSATGISRQWRWLKERKLVRTTQQQRRLKVFLKMEDASDKAYKRPDAYFFGFPLVYFLNGWHKELSLRGTVALLIALDKSFPVPTFQLRTEHAPRFFGVSADTMQRGLDELQSKGLLSVGQRPMKAPRAPRGFTMVNEYMLLGDFARPPREES
jgi:hypothetical protein